MIRMTAVYISCWVWSNTIICLQNQSSWNTFLWMSESRKWEISIDMCWKSHTCLEQWDMKVGYASLKATSSISHWRWKTIRFQFRCKRVLRLMVEQFVSPSVLKCGRDISSPSEHGPCKRAQLAINHGLIIVLTVSPVVRKSNGC